MAICRAFTLPAAPVLSTFFTQSLTALSDVPVARWTGPAVRQAVIISAFSFWDPG
jgi:hypothetical protein